MDRLQKQNGFSGGHVHGAVLVGERAKGLAFFPGLQEHGLVAATGGIVIADTERKTDFRPGRQARRQWQLNAGIRYLRWSGRRIGTRLIGARYVTHAGGQEYIHAVARHRRPTQVQHGTESGVFAAAGAAIGVGQQQLGGYGVIRFQTL